MAEMESLPELFIMFKRHAYICISTDTSVTIETHTQTRLKTLALGTQEGGGADCKGCRG